MKDYHNWKAAILRKQPHPKFEEDFGPSSNSVWWAVAGVLITGGGVLYVIVVSVYHWLR